MKTIIIESKSDHWETRCSGEVRALVKRGGALVELDRSDKALARHARRLWNLGCLPVEIRREG